MLFRPTTEADLARVVAVTVDEPVGWIDADRYQDELRQGMYRPEWTWIAEDDGRVVARALWWGADGQRSPRRPGLPVRRPGTRRPGGHRGRAAGRRSAGVRRSGGAQASAVQPDAARGLA